MMCWRPPLLQRLKMLKFNGYMEKMDKSWRHYFIDLSTESEFSDPTMEVSFVRDVKENYWKKVFFALTLKGMHI